MQSEAQAQAVPAIAPATEQDGAQTPAFSAPPVPASSPVGLQDLASVPSSSGEALPGLPQPQYYYPTRRFSDVTLEQIRAEQARFAAERDWDQLAEIFQWRSDAITTRDLPHMTKEEKEHVAEELSDVLLYLIRLSDVCGIDLGNAALDKMRRNAEKYPVSLAHGSSQKYTQLFPGRKDRASSSGSMAAQQQMLLAPMAANFAALHPGAKTPGGMGPVFAVIAPGSGDATEQMKRKRFTDEQVTALTQLAEAYNWSLTAVPQDERDRVLMTYQISKERLQNFFNNRKPKDLKKPRISKSDHFATSDAEEANAVEQLQNLQQGLPPSASTNGTLAALMATVPGGLSGVWGPQVDNLNLQISALAQHQHAQQAQHTPHSQPPTSPVAHAVLKHEQLQEQHVQQQAHSQTPIANVQQ